jgi:hypothetical protein
MEEKMRVVGFQSGTYDYFCFIHIYLFIYFVAFELLNLYLYNERLAASVV